MRRVIRTSFVAALPGHLGQWNQSALWAAWFSVLVGTTTLALSAPPARAAESKQSWSDILKFSALWYLHAEYGAEGGDTESRFHVSRGYLTARFKPVDWFSGRMTIDTHLDDDGYEIRLKYIHGRFTLPVETPYVSHPYLEFGQVHAPWLDFEQHINRYRMQGKMFLARHGMLDSSDLGVTIGALLGDELSDAEKEALGSKGFPGRWGSFIFGLYNGGGYKVTDLNENKVFEARLSVRPLGWIFPNLQISYGFIHGRGNTAEAPLWQNHTAMISLTHRYGAFAATYARGYGDLDGERVDGAGHALSNQGFSVFAEGRLPWINSSVMARYDWFDWEYESPESTLIVGYAFWFLGSNAILVDGEIHLPNDGSAPRDWRTKLTMQVKLP